jgi:hypothetical protein
VRVACARALAWRLVTSRTARSGSVGIPNRICVIGIELFYDLSSGRLSCLNETVPGTLPSTNRPEGLSPSQRRDEPFLCDQVLSFAVSHEASKLVTLNLPRAHRAPLLRHD